MATRTTEAEPATGCPRVLSENLSWLLAQASHALATRQTAGLESLGLPPRSYCVLATAMEGDRTQTELAQAVGVDKTTMVVTIDELEAAGLAERRPSKTDRRARVIGVTRAGRQKVAKAEEIVSAIQEDVLSALPARQREALLAALEGLIRGPLAEPAACSQPVRRRVPRS
jgi:MarR family transcriptional regulator, transcriptional regulator for hemolysin